jgi:hypothetical protein
MTLLAIRTELQETTGREDKNAMLDEQINAAIYHLGTRWKFPPLQSVSTVNTVDGEPSILLPTNVFAIFYIRENTSAKSTLQDGSWEEYLQSDRTGTGTPGKWCRYNQLLYIFNDVPDGVYEIEMSWWKRHPKLSSDTDEHLLMSEWEEAIRLLATEYAFTKLNEYQKAAASRERFNQYMMGRGLGDHTERGYKQNAGFNFGSN